MQTLHGIRFLPLLRIDGMQLGLDARWLRPRSVTLMLTLTVAALVGHVIQAAQAHASGPVAQAGLAAAGSLWSCLAMAGLVVPAIVLTSVGHELGHVVASRMAGLSVCAVVLAPQGGMTIRAGSDHPMVNFFTALAGPIANALLGVLCIALAVGLQLEGVLCTFMLELAALQLLTAAANLLPVGPMDGQRMRAAWQAASAPPGRTLPVV